MTSRGLTQISLRGHPSDPASLQVQHFIKDSLRQTPVNKMLNKSYVTKPVLRQIIRLTSHIQSLRHISSLHVTFPVPTSHFQSLRHILSPTSRMQTYVTYLVLSHIYRLRHLISPPLQMIIYVTFVFLCQHMDLRHICPTMVLRYKFKP